MNCMMELYSLANFNSNGKNMMRKLLMVVSFVLIGANTMAQETPVSPYAGQEARVIKSLSPDDIAELERGGGWGLAKTAELNGVPGPAHLLEMAEQIPLSAEQVEQISEIYTQMQGEAIAKGMQLIEQEMALEGHFQNRTITDEILRESLAAIARTRMELRYIHLATHLLTPEILSEEQIARYNELRGYGDPNPCNNVPEGHDAEMWRKHNGCD